MFRVHYSIIERTKVRRKADDQGRQLVQERKKEELRRKKSAFSELFLGVPCVLGAKPPNSAPKLTSDLRLPTSDLTFDLRPPTLCLCSPLHAPQQPLFSPEAADSLDPFGWAFADGLSCGSGNRSGCLANHARLRTASGGLAGLAGRQEVCLCADPRCRKPARTRPRQGTC